MPAASAALNRVAKRRANRKTRRAVRPVASATGSRTANAVSPSAASENEFSQYPSTGFSKYRTPLKRGETQSPDASISREISP
jgi:hypothetical protein